MRTTTIVPFPLGDKLPSNMYRPRIGTPVMGRPEVTPNGNTAIRVGRITDSGGWEQTEYLVLTPDEKAALVNALTKEQ